MEQILNWPNFIEVVTLCTINTCDYIKKLDERFKPVKVCSLFWYNYFQKEMKIMMRNSFKLEFLRDHEIEFGYIIDIYIRNYAFIEIRNLRAETDPQVNVNVVKSMKSKISLPGILVIFFDDYTYKILEV